ncbi:polyprenyl glycosylphosphotransferase [Actinocatenispora comari]|uniref:Polyprenyl glycosylphosphotransferase n=1 Tax=Actinocatenispora comari TaxID=2807577 RepID=A0A8J4AE44_9ACTN|nr:polyprenyl glycosylphosphotransferase [Actinocatenispora comari]
MAAEAWPMVDVAAPAARPLPAVDLPVAVGPARTRVRRRPWESRYLLAMLAGDLTVGLLAGAIGFSARFGPDVTAYNRVYLLVVALLPVGWVAALAANHAYEKRRLFVGTAEYERVLRAGVTLAAVVTVGSYLAEVRLSRGYVLIVLPLAVVATVLVRFALRQRLHRRRAAGRHLRRVVVLGHRRAVAQVCRQLHRERHHGLSVVGACVPRRRPRPTLGPAPDLGVPVLGTFADAGAAVAAVEADTVIVLSCPELDGVALRRLAWRLERVDVDLIVASALIDVAGRTTIRPVDGLPMLHVDHARLRGSARAAKALVDRCGAALLLLVLAPLLAAVAVAIKRDSPGPVLYRQSRVGRDGAVFSIWKFRSMYVDADARLAELARLDEGAGVLFKIRDDPRVTRVGRYLRRFSLDELPQLVNVLVGQMSLVGPRPPLPAEVARYPADMLRRLVVKPGLTGLWQVSGRSDLPWEEAIRLDLRYVETWSLSLDLVILLRTVTAVVRTSGAY